MNKTEQLLKLFISYLITISILNLEDINVFFFGYNIPQTPDRVINLSIPNLYSFDIHRSACGKNLCVHQHTVLTRVLQHEISGYFVTVIKERIC